jgi:hypothetical protein
MMARTFQVVDFPRVWDMAPTDEGSASESSDTQFSRSQSSDTKTSKISPEFRARLNQLEPQQKIRAIVLLETGRGSALPARRQTYDERRAAIAHLRETAQHAMAELNTLLQHFDGHPLAKAPDALGSVPVELSAAGIAALAEVPWVKAVLEDQEIHASRHSSLRAPKGRHG